MSCINHPKQREFSFELFSKLNKEKLFFNSVSCLQIIRSGSYRTIIGIRARGL